MLTALQLHERARAANSAWRFALARRLLLKGLDRAKDASTRAVLEGTLGFVEAELGDRAKGLTLIDSALRNAGELPEFEMGKLLAQRGLIRQRLGETHSALADYAVAVPLLSDRVDELGRARMNRGNLYLQQGAMELAIADFEAAAQALEEAGLTVLSAKARHNLGYAAMMTGQLIRALQLMSASAEVLRPVSVEGAAVSDQDRAEALLSAGMFEEGRSSLRQAAQLFGRKGWRRAQAEAELVLARTWVLDDPAEAARWARQSARHFVAAGAPAWSLRCEAVIQASLIERGRGSASDASALAGRLARHRLSRDATWMQVYAAKAALAIDGRVPRLRVPSDSPLSTRLLACEVRAQARGLPRDALRILRSGLDELLDWQSTLGSLDLQTATVSHGDRLVRRGLELALTDGRPALIYEWLERASALAGRITPVRPHPDPQIAEALSELRLLSANGDDPTGRRTVLLALVRESSWQGDGSHAVTGIVGLGNVREQLAEAGATLVAPFTGLGKAWALIVGARRTTLVPLGSLDRIRAELAGLPADLDLAAADLPLLLVEAVRLSLRDRLARLDALILEPVAPLLTTSRVVINPSGIFSGLAWALMPTLAGKSITIPRSASAWVSGRQRPHEYALAGFASGPRLDRAEPEVIAAAGHWPAPEVLVGESAHSTAVSELAGRADVLHLAAHGHHVPDNPLFSTLELVDGPWFGYDLDQLPQVPETVILSACELGTTTIRRGDELLGLTTAWLHAGARCVIAAPASVSDAVAEAILPLVHRELAAGTPPADALALANAQHPELMATFQCYGAGW